MIQLLYDLHFTLSGWAYLFDLRGQDIFELFCRLLMWLIELIT